MELPDDPNSKPNRPNEDFLFAWHHLIVIFIIGVLIVFPCMSVSGPITGLIDCFKFLFFGSAFTYLLRIFMHERRGLIQNQYVRFYLNVFFAVAFLGFYVYSSFGNLIIGFFSLFIVIPLFGTLYYNLVIGRPSPFNGW